MTDQYDAQKDGEQSYYVAIEAKRLRGDHKIEALERNLFALERLVHDLQKDIQDIKKALRDD
jgi:predicted  nucleic acid-binding Zn-ribbon protein